MLVQSPWMLPISAAACSAEPHFCYSLDRATCPWTTSWVGRQGIRSSLQAGSMWARTTSCSPTFKDFVRTAISYGQHLQGQTMALNTTPRQALSPVP
eukprot:364550-Chlamydomonas_euryale.AAC.1